jgi:hypothetical protein
MHYSNLNPDGNDEDNFRPSDLIDIESGDSDNEILAQFRPKEKKMISLQQPVMYKPPYLNINAVNSTAIDDQTGY